MEEKRQATIDHVLIALGEIKQVGLQNAENIKGLNEKVSIQNGRVRKLEGFQQFLCGMSVVICIFILPILIFIIQQWIEHHK